MASRAGHHRVEVRALEEAVVKGRYELEVLELRAATATDRARVEAVNLFNEGEGLRAEWRAEATREAVERYERSLGVWKRLGDQAAQARTLVRLGDAHRALGALAPARDGYRRAVHCAREGGDTAAEIRSLNALSQVELLLGDEKEALNTAEVAAELSQRTADLAGEAEALNSIGDVHWLMGRIGESLQVYRSALERAEQGGTRRAAGRALRNLGFSHSDLSEVKEAFESFGRSLSLWREVGDLHGLAITLNGLGHLHSKVGEKQQALGHYGRASEILERLGDPIGAGITASGMGFVYVELGEEAVALGYYEEQLRLHRLAAFPEGEAGALTQIGRCRYALGDLPGALASLRQALSILDATQNRMLDTYANGLLGLVYEAMGETADALDCYERSLKISQQIGDQREESYARNRAARLLRRLGRTEEALEHLRQAVASSELAKDRVGEALSLFTMAGVEETRGRLDVALSLVRRSLEVSEAIRSSVASLHLRASYFASVRARHELEIRLLMALHGQRPGEGYDRQGFDASEKARARSLLDGLAETRAGIREGVDPRLLDRETSLRRSLNAKAERLTRLGGDPEQSEVVAPLEREVDDLTVSYRELEAQVRVASPRYAALTQPRPVTLAEVQRRVVDRQSILLQYFLGEPQSYLWAITPQGIDSHVLPPRERIEALVRELRSTLAVDDPSAGPTRRPRMDDTWRAAAAELSRILLDPVAQKIKGRRLLVAPDGVLHLMPLAALPAPGADRGAGTSPPLLVQEHEIVTLPSASTVALLRGDWEQPRAWHRPVAIFADPVFERDDPRIDASPEQAPSARKSPGSGDPAVPGVLPGFPRLLHTRNEARSIADLAPGATVYQGFDASRGGVTRGQLSRYRIVHFATHGVVTSDHPELSGIVLSLFDRHGSPQDGFLRLHDIYNLHLPIDLVVLSACRTALGRSVTGEGLVGLVRGFMYAGSRQVLASLWDVDDESTSELMRRFYVGVLREGLTPAAALRAAQVEILERKRWRHPRHWAAFVLQGDWESSESGTPRASPETARIARPCVESLRRRLR